MKGVIDRSVMPSFCFGPLDPHMKTLPTPMTGIITKSSAFQPSRSEKITHLVGYVQVQHLIWLSNKFSFTHVFDKSLGLILCEQKKSVFMSLLLSCSLDVWCYWLYVLQIMVSSLSLLPQRIPSSRNFILNTHILFLLYKIEQNPKNVILKLWFK